MKRILSRVTMGLVNDDGEEGDEKGRFDEFYKLNGRHDRRPSNHSNIIYQPHDHPFNAMPYMYDQTTPLTNNTNAGANQNANASSSSSTAAGGGGGGDGGAGMNGVVSYDSMSMTPPLHATHHPTVLLRKSRNLVLLGGSMSGKTAICVRIASDRYDDSYEPTMQATYTKVVVHKGQEIELMLKDTQGIQDNEQIGSEYGLGYHGYILVFSVTSRRSFETVKLIHQKLVQLTGTSLIPTILVGNKADSQPNAAQQLLQNVRGNRQLQLHNTNKDQNNTSTANNNNPNTSSSGGKSGDERANSVEGENGNEQGTGLPPHSMATGINATQQPNGHTGSTPSMPSASQGTSSSSAPPVHYHRQVSKQEAQSLARGWGNRPYVEVSAKYDINIDTVVRVMLDEIDKQNASHRRYSWAMLNPIVFISTMNEKFLSSAKSLNLQSIEYICQLMITLVLLLNVLLLLVAVLIVRNDLYGDDCEFVSYMCFAYGLLFSVISSLGLVGIHRQTIEYLYVFTTSVSIANVVEIVTFIWVCFEFDSFHDDPSTRNVSIAVVSSIISIQVIAVSATYIFQNLIAIQQQDDYSDYLPMYQALYNT